MKVIDTTTRLELLNAVAKIFEDRLHESASNIYTTVTLKDGKFLLKRNIRNLENIIKSLTLSNDEKDLFIDFTHMVREDNLDKIFNDGRLNKALVELGYQKNTRDYARKSLVTAIRQFSISDGDNALEYQCDELLKTIEK